ncbi:hypothetical protein BBJ28_00000476 [Nothophytophthora sp. Chile5]|nr:hypothetical protein BBJ28_00000476 [Nothophytophthora sp. Chile5]
MDASSPPSTPALHDEWALVNDEAEYVNESFLPLMAVGTSGRFPCLPCLVLCCQEPEDAVADVAATAEAVPEGCLRIRLRKGEEIHPAWFKATQLVDDFIGKLANDKKIRLIYMGMLLIPNRSMGEYGIEDDGVIHCVVTDAPPAPHPQAARHTELKSLSNPRNSLLILTGVVLYGLWTLFYHFPHFFSWKSIVLLSLFSVIHISAAVSRFAS